MQINLHKQNKAFSLLELLLYIAISSTVIVVNLSLLTTMLRARVKNQTISEIESQGAHIMQYIGQSIRHSEDIVSPSPNAQPSPTLSLTRNNQGELEDIVIGEDEQIMWVWIDAEEGEALTTTNILVEDVSFDNLTEDNSPGMVYVEFTLSRLNPAGMYEFDYSQTFSGSFSLR